MRKSRLKFFLFNSAFCILHSVFTVQAQTDSLLPFNNVQGKLMFKQRYCGGARPSEELLAMLDSLRTLPNTTVYLARQRGGKLLYKLTSDAKGNFKKRMRAGKYYVYMTKKYEPGLLTNFNPNCEEWMKSIFGEVEIINGGKKLYNINLHFDCDPCSPPRP